MKLVLGFLFIASASAGQLSNLYLPANVVNTANTITSFNTIPSGDVTNPSVTSTEAPAATSNSTPSLNPTLPLSSVSNPTIFYGVPLVNTYATVAPPIAILRSGLNQDSRGSYSYEYETANHIVAQESGNSKAPDSSEVKGSYSYLAPNGQTISLSYVADENGFRPTGDHLPTPPPIPEAILKSLQLNAAEEAKGIVNDGQYLPPSNLVVTKQILTPSITAQYIPVVPKQENLVLRRIVAPSLVTPSISTQYLPALRSQAVEKINSPAVSSQYLSTAPVNVGYK